MGFRFQRRVNLSGGWGLNLGKSGGSLSYRGRDGSIGTRGFSLRTGIPGLSFRQNWGKDAGAVFLLIGVLLLAAAALAALVQVLLYVIPIVWRCLVWLALTLYDFGVFLVQKVRDLLAARSASP